MSTLEVNKITPSTGTSITLGDSGDTFTIPSGVTLTNNGSASGFGGITEADMFILSSSYQAADGVNFITSNLTRPTADGFTQIGTGMTESSGVFTFPSTGLYHVSVVAAMLTNNGAAAFASVRIFATTDNSTYNTRSSAYSSSSGTNEYCSTYNHLLFNVTNTSTHKIKFGTEMSGNITVNGSDTAGTRFNFIRLGDSQ